MNIPPFCPNRECILHNGAPPHSDWYVRDVHYRSAAHGRVQRFRCKRCGRCFSGQTFSIDYAVNQMERLAIYRAYHNYFKPYRIGAREEGKPTHTEKEGVPARAIRGEMKSFFTQRRFLSRVKAPMIGERKVWLRMI
ncbi:MAG: hypothetical protein SVR04_04845, partial [Spirochaetota bacterium]|nr:hypothetical protein [Spirochaetota bacterium]